MNPMRALPFAVLLSAQFLARTGLDWFAPPADFHFRSTVSTLLGVGIFLAASMWAAWRSNSFAAGVAAGALTAGLAAAISIAGAAAMLAVWHDPQTLNAIRSSGGIEEVFVLPVMMIVPGLILGTAGSAASTACKKLLFA